MQRLLWLTGLISGVVIFALALDWHLFRGGPALLAHLPKVETQASDEFDRRIKACFPVGSSTAKMEQALQADGFGRPHPYKRQYYVELERSRWFLEERFVVLWEDDEGKLTAIMEATA